MQTPEDTLFDKLSATEKEQPSAPVEESKGEPEKSRPVTLRNLFTHPDTHSIVLNFALQKSFGDEWHHWEAETIWDEIKDTFGSQISELNQQKIRALQALHCSLLPWLKWQVFEKVAVAMNNVLPNPKIMQPLSLEDLYVAVDIISGIRQETYSSEVRLYMAACVLEEDVFFVPPPLDFIQKEVAQPYHHCKDCGNSESALSSDGICSNCSGRLHPEQGLSLEPREDLLKQGLGKNTQLLNRFDPTSVQKKWDEVKDKPTPEFPDIPETMEEAQVGKLLLARDCMNYRRKQLAEQLTTLKSWLGAQ